MTGLTAVRVHPLFAELRTPGDTLAIASTKTVPMLGDGAAESVSNRSVALDFLVDDVDTSYEQLAGSIESFVNEPTDMPWGNRSLLFCDPDGNLVRFFTPTSAEAAARFES
ncbi:VOC family protein [Agromyces archimandritae]|uniref:VOC family protein n=1 Tax=Agromyces archimandritae TaxID=2781962 RepID=A0A975FPB8_9MICO|nr:VOC family protein [Agromyces archimandritae]QTX04711.1 VOC family protein [Agromyces archimandritae]